MSQVSVIIPTFNRSNLVCQTVANVLAQSLTPAEVIVVDDGSTDDTLEQLNERFGDAIQVISQMNAGPGAARNRGLEAARGDFIWLMDSDDLASLNQLECQVDTLQREEADIVYGPWARAYIDGQCVRLDGPVLQRDRTPSERDELWWFVTNWSLVLQQCLFRAECLRRAGGYRTDIWSGEDGELFVRVLAHGAKVTFVHNTLTLYRLNDTGKLTASGVAARRRTVDWAKCLLAIHDHCSNRPEIAAHPEYQRRLWQAYCDLIAHCPDESMLAERLRAHIHLDHRRLRVGCFVNRMRLGIRQRLRGHRWSPAYRPGPLTNVQRKLIEEMGLHLAELSQ
ncbi:MAG: glycosyltransferase family 2 protein [Planctomycetales bacterium]|nr:glycosyltransferase family 2 protein [Planctomycetales bacterium]